MGVVYKARQVNLNRIVALKLLPLGPFSREHAVQRFQAEATAAASLQHPNIVAIHDVGEHEGQHFFSMDFVEGHTLAELVRDQPLPARRAAGYLKSIAQAVHYAHQQGILHRDLKPSNVLIDAFDQPRITDFGLAKRLNENLEFTRTGQVLGSPNFISPEQAEGRSQNIGPPTDLYSLGAMLYHLLTRQPPFQAETLTTLLKQVLETDPVPPRRLNPSIPADLETICLKCLEKEPGRRYATAQALAEDLGRYLDEKPIHARPVGPPAKAWKWCRRRPALAGVTATLLATFILGLGGVLWQWQRATLMARAELLQRQRAQAEKYAADMHLAHLALKDNHRALTLSLLDKYHPGRKAESGKQKSKTDPRGWEWRYLWQLCQGDELLKLRQYPRPILDLTVSRRKDLLAVATGEEVAIWDLVTRKPLSTVPVRARGTMAFSPGAELLAAGTWNAKREPVIELWAITDTPATRQRTLEVGNRSFSFSPDGKLLAAFDARGEFTLTDCTSWNTITRFDLLPLRDTGAGLAIFSPDGNRVAIGEEYGRLRLYDVKSGTNLFLRTQTGSSFSAAAFSPDSRLLAAGIGYQSGTIRLWDVRSGEPRGDLTKHTANVTALTFTPDSTHLISASMDRTIRIWRIADQTEVRCLQSAREDVRAVALLDDGKMLVSGGSDGSVCIWDTARPRPATHTNLAVGLPFEALGELKRADFALDTLHPTAVRHFGVAFAPDSKSFITTDNGGGLARWDAQSLEWRENLPAFGSNHWAVALSPDGHWLATGDAPSQVTLWDSTTRREVTRFAVEIEWWGLLRFSPSGQYFIASTRLNNMAAQTQIRRTGTWEEVPLSGSDFEGLTAVDISADDQLLAAGYRNGAVDLFRWPAREHVARLGQSNRQVLDLRFSPDGRRLCAVGFDRQARIWDVAGRRLEALLPAPVGSFCGAVFSPNGDRLATSGVTPRDAIKLWDLASQRELLSLQGDGSYFAHLASSPDGSILTATSFSGIAHFWRAPSWQEVELVEQRQAASVHE